jgi:hypothetical protein
MSLPAKNLGKIPLVSIERKSLLKATLFARCAFGRVCSKAHHPQLSVFKI